MTSDATIGHKKQLGNAGESFAETFLINQGFSVVEKNWRCRGGEIDLIVSERDALHFVEVKTRTDNRFGSPILAINYAKQRKLRRLAEIYLATHPRATRFSEICFSCLGISLDIVPPKIEWMPRAFGI